MRDNERAEKNFLTLHILTLFYILEIVRYDKKYTEETDKKSLSSGSVPSTGLFYEPFLKDLDLIWCIEPKVDGLEWRDLNYA